VDFSYKRTGVSKQFKQASARRARYAIVVGAELAERNELTVKNLSTGRQELVPADRLRAGPAVALEAV
jgi:histidyl-tRNA synthetase